jgi:hypothetical protein
MKAAMNAVPKTLKEASLATEYKTMQYDPRMLQTVMLLKASGKTPSYIQRVCGVTTQTLRNWEKKKTKRPQAATMDFALRTVGYQLVIRKI